MKLRIALIAACIFSFVCYAGAALYRYQQVASQMTTAALDFLESLPAEKRAVAQMEFSDPARLDWHFIPKDQRKGLQIKDMTADERKRAGALLSSGLSQLGYEKAELIMSLEEILRELEKERKGGPLRDPERYYVTVFGQPQLVGEWGYSVEGHHLSLNFVVRDGRVASASPAMYGANPAEVKSDVGVGPKKGTQVLRAEEQLAFDLLAQLSDEQKQKAVIAQKAPNEIRGAGEPTAPITTPEGLIAADMTDAQKKTLSSLITAYIDNMSPDVQAEIKDEIHWAELENVYFAWAGAQQPGIGHYYRVQGPTFLIEFVNTQPDSAGNPANHIHSVWRQLDDFGATSAN